jgi:LPS export ABC transporter protein LptC
MKLSLLVIVFILIPGLAFCVEPSKDGPQIEEGSQQIDGFFLAGYGDRGKKTWDIAGKTAEMSGEIVKMDDITGNLYGEKENIKLTADTGDFNRKDGKVHLEDNVVITTTSGAKLITDSMDWDRKNEVVSTPDLVNITRDNIKTVGKGAQGEPSLKKVSLKEDVQVDILPVQDKDKKLNKIVITCDGPLDVDYDKNIATFNNNVRVETQDNIMQSDIMDVYFITSSNKGDKKSPGKDPSGFGMAGSSIDKIIARGSVKITRGENISYSQEAVYRSQDRKITLNGRPQLIIYSQEDLGASFGN